jgi:hypothetical protein
MTSPQAKTTQVIVSNLRLTQAIERLFSLFRLRQLAWSGFVIVSSVQSFGADDERTKE